VIVKRAFSKEQKNIFISITASKILGAMTTWSRDLSSPGSDRYGGDLDDKLVLIHSLVLSVLQKYFS
jgi:hypothetical protein